MYADKITDSMRKTIDETQRRREKQMAYNIANGIVPKTIIKPLDTAWGETLNKQRLVEYETAEESIRAEAAEKTAIYRSPKDIRKAIQEAKKEMEKSVKELDFMNAAKYRDIIVALEEKLNKID